MNSTDIIRICYHYISIEETRPVERKFASIDRLKNVTFDSHQFNIDSFMQEFGHHQSKSIFLLAIAMIISMNKINRIFN